MRYLSIAIVGSILAVCTWRGGPTAPEWSVPGDLATAPTRVLVAGKILTLETSLWRDFMPVVPPDGRPLSGVLRVSALDRSAVPAAVRADAVWLLSSTGVWNGVPREERSRAETAPVYEVVVRDGPRWPAQLHVDVVVRLVDGEDRSYLLRAPDQVIGAVY